MSQQGNDKIVISIISILISASALGVSLFTLFWDRLRKTNLKVFIPRQVAIVDSDLIVALTFYADGPKPILIQDLQLFQHNGQSHYKLKYFVDEFPKGKPTKITSFTLNSREQLTLFCGFDITGIDLLFIQNEIFDIKSKLGNNEKWTGKLCQFSLKNIENVNHIKTWFMSSIDDPFE
jgi:hypothetical protein